MAAADQKVTVYLTPDDVEALREEHARTYPEHRLKWLAWLSRRLLAGLETEP